MHKVVFAFWAAREVSHSEAHHLGWFNKMCIWLPVRLLIASWVSPRGDEAEKQATSAGCTGVMTLHAHVCQSLSSKDA